MCELSARITPGDPKCLQYRNAVSQSCRACNPHKEFVPVLQFDPAEMKKQPNKGNQSRLGSVTSPAADLAVKYFESINSHLDAGGSWITICNLIKQATGQVFHAKTMKRYFNAERVKRGMPVRELLQGCPKSRPSRLWTVQA